MNEPGNDIAQWIQELTRRSLAEQIRSLQRYNDLIQRVARGELNEQSLREEYMRFVREESLHYARQLTTLSLNYYSQLIEVSRAYNDQFFQQILRGGPQEAQPEAQPPAPPQQVVMSMSGAQGSDLSGSFVLENKRPEAADISFQVAEFLDEDGQNPFRPPLQIQPPRFTLGPRQETVVRFSVPLLTGLFEAGKVYTTSILVRGYEDLVLVLKIKVEPPAAEERVTIRPAIPEAASKGVQAVDDLTRLKGLGPRYAERLMKNGIHNYAQLAALDPARMVEILGGAGARQALRYRCTEQAALAAAGDLAGLKALQEEVSATPNGKEQAHGS